MLQIFILAGGFGTRLSEIISDVPKSMALINGLPFLVHQINLLKRSLINIHVNILTFYKSEIIEDYFDKYDDVTIIRESEPLGTGGAIKNAIKVLKLHKDDNILVLNGDSYIDVNYSNFINNSMNDINILCTRQSDCERSSTLEISDGIIRKFNKQGVNKNNSLISTGCYYFKNTSIIQDNVSDKFMIEELFEKFCEKIDINTHIYNGAFIDIGTPKDYLNFCEYIKNEN